MNLFCKAVSPLLVLSSFLILSCDKSDCGLDCDEVVFEGLPIDPTPTDDVVSAGGLFTFEDILNTNEFQHHDNLRMTDDNEARVAHITYLYEKIGEFTASLTASFSTEELVDTAVTQMFESTNVESVEVQSLLLVRDASEDAPDLTEEELGRLIELMRQYGATVSRHPDGALQIVTTPFVQYVMTTTSDEEVRSRGLVAGTYTLGFGSQVLIFEITTSIDGEGNSYQYYLPIVSPETIEVQLLEEGTYTLELNSTIDF